MPLQFCKIFILTIHEQKYIILMTCHSLYSILFLIHNIYEVSFDKHKAKNIWQKYTQSLLLINNHYANVFRPHLGLALNIFYVWVGCTRNHWCKHALLLWRNYLHLLLFSIFILLHTYLKYDINCRVETKCIDVKMLLKEVKLQRKVYNISNPNNSIIIDLQGAIVHVACVKIFNSVFVQTSISSVIID
jgi:hypothetical protein